MKKVKVPKFEGDMRAVMKKKMFLEKQIKLSDKIKIES